MDHYPLHGDLTGSEGTGRKRRRLSLRVRQLLGWCVHFYTALGLVAAGGMAVAIFQGTPESFRLAFLLMVVATLIDATDGTFARLIKIKDVLPGFDGRRLDDIVDFQTYVTLPLLLLWRAGIVPAGQEAWLLAPLLASAYGFCQVSAKTSDGYFLGFPSYWNIVAFYLYVLQPPGWLAVTLLAGFSVLVFVPSRYLYPSMRGRLNRFTNQLAAVWAVLLVAVLWLLPGNPEPGQTADSTVRLGAYASLFFPAYYLGVSWALSLGWLKKRSLQRAAEKVEVDRSEG
jgi:phosphatidylcholine synthase